MRQNMLNRLFCPAFGQYNVTIDVRDGKACFADSEYTKLEALHGFSLPLHTMLGDNRMNNLDHNCDVKGATYFNEDETGSWHNIV